MPPLALPPLRVWRAVAATAGRSVADFLYPPGCIGCAAPTGDAHALCAACWRQMPFIARPYCERLGTPFAFDSGPGLVSPAAMAAPPDFGRARTVARYEGPARELVHRLKYGDRLDLAPSMGAWMASAGSEILAGADLLVPVPLHRWRLWRRRHNQAAVLAHAVSRVADVPARHDVLARVRSTRPQVGLSRNERAENLRGAFRAGPTAPAALAGVRVVLVDDVMTTGATANAAARVLLRAGAAQVDVLTFATVCAPP
jgi:ComF family protein